MLFTLKKIVGGLLLPLPALLLLIGIGIALLWFSRFQRTGKLCVSLGWLLLTLLSLFTVTFYYAMNATNIYIVLKDGMAKRAQVIMMEEDASE